MPVGPRTPLVSVVHEGACRPPGADGSSPEPGRVGVWRAELHRHRRSWTDASLLLPEDECAALEPLAEPHRSRRLAARVLQRTVLARYLGVRRSEVTYVYGPAGKPSLGGELAASGLEFSPSTSGDCWLLAVSTAGPVGIDIEVVRPVPEADSIVERHFHRDEAAALAGAGTADERLRWFLRSWTAKEAYGKAFGSGLVPALQEFVVPPSFAAAHSFGEAQSVGEARSVGEAQSVAGDDPSSGPWCLVRLDSQDIVATLAARSSARHLSVVVAELDPTWADA